MTTTPPESGTDTSEGPRVSRDEMRELGRLRRSRSDRKVAGVAGGLGRHLDVDPLVLRVVLVVLIFFGGAGLIVYGACWLLVPEDGSDSAVVSLDERSRGVALIVVGVLAALALIGDSWGAFWFPWPLAAIALIVWLVLRRDRGRQSPRPTPPVSPTHAPAYAPAYGPTYGPAQDAAWPTETAPFDPPPYVAPRRNPRRTGPILFWFTLALIALCEGVLGIVDLAGVSVGAGAYAALAVAITGAMLVVGSFFGRAGGLILVGLMASAVMLGATLAGHWDSEGWGGERITTTPTLASTIDQRYWTGAGEQVLDLREVRDLENLDGRRIAIEGGIGRIEVILPDDLAAEVDADVNGPGSIDLFGDEAGGVDIHRTQSERPSPSEPVVVIDAELGVGEIQVSYR